MRAVTEHRFDEVREVANRERDLLEAVVGELPYDDIEDRLVADRKQRLGKHGRVRRQACSLATGEDYGLLVPIGTAAVSGMSVAYVHQGPSADVGECGDSVLRRGRDLLQLENAWDTPKFAPVGASEPWLRRRVRTPARGTTRTSSGSPVPGLPSLRVR